MKGILAIETATEACSLALWRPEQLRQLHELTPRQHSQRLFAMLRELLPDGPLALRDVEAIAYGCGPGSFTGLRIAASAVQGLAFAAGLPAIPVSTLACQAQTALRRGLAGEGDVVLSTLDARINEIYYAWFRVEDAVVAALTPPRAVPPAQLSPARGVTGAVAVGSGLAFSAEFPPAVAGCIGERDGGLVPEARDLVPLALAAAARGELQRPQQVQPVYLRDEISWKKVSEQGKRK